MACAGRRRASTGCLPALPGDRRPSLRSGRRESAARAASCWPGRSRIERLSDLRQAIASARVRRGELRRDDAQLVLATAHGTKGLEFDHVAVIGMDDNVFPSRRTLEDSDDPNRAIEEERRLAYVAWTRAEEVAGARIRPRRAVAVHARRRSATRNSLLAGDRQTVRVSGCGAGPPRSRPRRAGWPAHSPQPARATTHRHRARRAGSGRTGRPRR